MKKTIQLFAVAALMATSFAACKKDETPTPPPPAAPKAKVVFVHTCISANNLKVNINGTALASVTDLAFLATSGYKELDPVTGANVEFRFAGSNGFLTGGTQTFEANKFYTVIATGIVTSPAFVGLTDDLTAPASGKAKVRFVNLSVDSLSEDVYVGSTLLTTGLNYPNASSFYEVTAGTQTAIMQDPANVPAGRNLSMDFVAGKIYTIMLTGIEVGSGDAQLKLTSILHN